MRGGSNALMLEGQVIGCYRVLGRAPHTSSAKEHSRWRVKCETCGYTKTVAGHNLVRSFPLRCNHVPAGHRVVGPREVAVLKACESIPDEVLHAPIVHAEQLYPLCDAIQIARREGAE